MSLPDIKKREIREMAAATSAIWIRPPKISAHSLIPRQYTIGFLRPILSSSSSVSVGEYSSRDIRLRSRNTMVGVRAGTGDGVAGAGAFDQEALVDGSSSFAAGGLEAFLNDMSKWLAAASFVVVLLMRHDAEALWAAIGCVLNIKISTVLKNVLNQARPVAHLKPDPGMPSSHAQSFFYVATFSVLSIVHWFGLNVLTIATSALVVAVASYFTWLRVSQQLHTVSQIVVGALLGTVCAIMWSWCWNSFVLKAFVSHLWVRVLVVLGAAGFSVSFAVHLIRYSLMESVALRISRNLQS